MTEEQTTERGTDSVPGAGQQHGSSSGEGGTVGSPANAPGETLEHPKPDTPESKKEHQADLPGVTTGGDSQGSHRAGQEKVEEAHKAEGKSFHGGQSEQAYYGTGQLGELKLGEQPNAGSRG
jgi:hypothetical protein